MTNLQPFCQSCNVFLPDSQCQNATCQTTWYGRYCGWKKHQRNPFGIALLASITGTRIMYGLNGKKPHSICARPVWTRPRRYMNMPCGMSAATTKRWKRMTLRPHSLGRRQRLHRCSRAARHGPGRPSPRLSRTLSPPRAILLPGLPGPHIIISRWLPRRGRIRAK